MTTSDSLRSDIIDGITALADSNTWKSELPRPNADITLTIRRDVLTFAAETMCTNAIDSGDHYAAVDALALLDSLRAAHVSSFAENYRVQVEELAKNPPSQYER